MSTSLDTGNICLVRLGAVPTSLDTGYVHLVGFIYLFIYFNIICIHNNQFNKAVFQEGPDWVMYHFTRH